MTEDSKGFQATPRFVPQLNESVERMRVQMEQAGPQIADRLKRFVDLAKEPQR